MKKRKGFGQLIITFAFAYSALLCHFHASELKENGDLYGSIKPKEISNLIKEKTSADVSPSQIILKEELNKIGIYKIDINFHSEVKANISLKISKIQTK